MANTGAGGLSGNDGGDGGGGEQRDPGVSAEVLWKARAEDAEDRLAELEASLDEARATIARVERRGEIDRELSAARALDLETARLMTEAAIEGMDEQDVALAVRDLRERKPFLFEQGVVAGGVARGGVSMSPSPGGDGACGLGSMARSARCSGDRGDLLRYLRARRVI